MTQQNPVIKCAKCNIALQGPINAKPNDRIACPVCGEGDTLEQVTREVGEQALEPITRKLFDGLSRNKHIKITKKPIPKKPHRFIVDLDLH